MKRQPDDNDVLRTRGRLALDPESGLDPLPLLPGAEFRDGDPAHGCWSRAVTAEKLLGQNDDEVDWLVEGIAAPRSVTGIASPRGLGKSHFGLALAIAAATGSDFMGKTLTKSRVLLLDRDNSRREVRRRLRGWGAARDLGALKVLTRDECPALTDTAAWQNFPFADYDIVILDSLGAATEGVEDNRGGESSKALAPLLDLARRGPAVIVALNAPKNGLNYRGSGVIADRFDILYEVRDATDLKPDAKHANWWDALAEGQGESGWASRAGRRRQRSTYRLAFVASKFRIGEEPDPRCVEIDLSGDWCVRDVTEELEADHEAARGEADAQRGRSFDKAVESLAALVLSRWSAGNALNKTEAEQHLREMGLTQKHARRTLERLNGESWLVKPSDGRSLILVPCESRLTTRSQDEVLPSPSTSPADPSSVALAPQGQRDLESLNPLCDKGQRAPQISLSSLGTPAPAPPDDEQEWGELEVDDARN